MKPIKKTLCSSALVHTPGMVRAWSHMARTGGLQLAFTQMSLGFPELPGLMVLDIITGRLVGKPGLQKDSLSYTWSGPLGKAEDYIQELVPKQPYAEHGHVLGCPRCGHEWHKEEGTPCPACGY